MYVQVTFETNEGDTRMLDPTISYCSNPYLLV